MAKKVSTEKELGEALRNNEDTIEITGDLAKKTIKLRATGRVAWAVAIAAIGIAVYSAMTIIPSGGTTAVPAGMMGAGFAPVAVAVLDTSVTYSAIAIAITAGGIGSLTTLRNYKEVSRSSNSLILKRR